MILPKEKQCVSFETARRMNDLGFRQDTEWYWHEAEIWATCNEVVKMPWELCLKPTKKGFGKYFAAYTTSELGVILPGRLRLEDADYWLRISKHKNGDYFDVRYHCFRSLIMSGKVLHDLQADTMAESMGLMACYLKEQGLL